MPNLFLRSGLEPFPGYRLSRRLGSGGFGEVWAADSPRGKPAALKFLPCASGSAAAREIRSLQAIRQLQHPHLIRMDDVWCYKECLVVAMELADGSLADLLETYQSTVGSPVAPEHACLLFSEAADALDFLNSRKHRINEQWVAIQHCDIKPNNLLLVGDTLKVADFGLATLMTENVETRDRCGTLAYCAPEIFQGHVSRYSDQYGLAVSYCAVRGGRLPFADTPTSFRSGYVRPKPDLSMLTLKERALVARALDPVPQNRWPSSRALFTQLSGLFCGVPDSRVTKVKSGVPRSQRACT